MTDGDAAALGVLWYTIFLLSTTCHEAAHALVAKWGGDMTAFYGGQVTLNPWPHIRREPFGTVIVPILTYAMGGGMIGWASAPYDPFWSRRHPRRAAWMSLAGPAANFLLLLGSAASIHAGIAAGLFQPPATVGFTHVVEATVSGGVAEGVAKFLSILFSLNLLLGTFNLLPLPPLDGYSALGLLTSEAGATRLQDFAERLRAFTFVGLLVGWQLFQYVFGPVFFVALQLLYPWAAYGR